MSKQIKIGSNIYAKQYSQEVADSILNKLLEWMVKPEHYSSYSGESFMQSDNTIINATDLIADIVDDILKPKFIKEYE